eukprot:11772381-Ditylum_brightwellii.AAC.1
MKEILYKLHITHFGQAQGKDFTIPPLSTQFGEYTDTEFSNKFRTGQIYIVKIEGASALTKKNLHELSLVPTDPQKSIQQSHQKMSRKDFESGKKWPQHPLWGNT